MKFNVLDLFSGIGGFSLGLERTGGFQTVAFCEIEEYPRRVIAEHWPEVPIYEDVRNLNAARLAEDGTPRPDVLCGGFPCQDISAAGKGAGLAGSRSGLWSEYARLIREIQPQYAIVENSERLTRRGLGAVLGDLAAIGYDAEWSCVSACSLGFPHMRKRLWLVAYPSRERRQQRGRLQFAQGRDSSRNIRERFGQPEPLRVAHGVPYRVDRNSSLGNAVVPDIPEMIGNAILRAEAWEAA